MAEQDETGDMVPTLLEDCIHAHAAQVQEQSAFARRQFIRAAFAAIEAALFEIRKKLLQDRRSRRFDAGVVCLLRDETYGLDKKGQIVSSTRWGNFESSVLFLVRLYTQPLRSKRFRIDTSQKEWSDLKTALKVRHRLTHPKSEKDLDVSKTEYRATCDSLFWIFGLLQDATRVHLRRQERSINRQKQAFEKRQQDLKARTKKMLRELLADVAQGPQNQALNPAVGRGRPPAG